MREPPEFTPIGELVAAHARARPHAPALTVGEETLSWAELGQRVEAIAQALGREGLRPGHAIAILAASSIPHVALFLGALRAGVAVAPLPTSATPQQLAAMVADAGATLVFADETHRAALAEVGPPARLEALEALEGFRGETPARPFDPCVPAEAWPGLAFNIIYSSGTTGVPKGIVHSHAMRWAHLVGGRAAGYDETAVTLLSTPLHSNTTLVAALPTLAWGGHLVLMPKFDVEEFLALSARHRATYTMLVPVQYRRILEHPRFSDFDLSSYRLKFATSAPFPAELKRAVLDRFPGGLIEYYGMTEGGGTVLVAHKHPHKLHTVGHPIPGHEILILDDQDRPLPPGEVGEIVGHSPATMTGYANRPEATAAAQWRHPDGRVFIRTGDLGRFDADGFLEIVGRKKDMIISGGFNVYPVDLEAALLDHPAVVEAAVVGVPSARWGETPVAFVVLRHAVEPEDLRAFANARLGKVQRIARVIVVPELPRSPIGKVLKRELRAQAPTDLD
ncbi:MAG: acyl--CoA ligase [Sphingomonadaceae bacterium]|uniref:class I adenylate-forming enzyme family protein n=1 Tax=Thermaurantiacus sp. TaxID=2820283 RepID=UPI00298EFD43|nr:class I adenylate-forming enzyme family protein [Thermaurantiacus sp.]MCS6987424.1 acyl--CoA ligase [Sphingomonadaceae bacterium]MDW8415344.1 class I adenylate-forming enzyme family protein [Thermaurantiacus sp.]